MIYDPRKFGIEPEEVPSWMRPMLPKADWGLVAMVVLCTLATLPLFLYEGLPPTFEAELQMYRVLVMSESLREGDLYPRWAADFNYGYGSPLFNYLAPLPHYLGGLYGLLTDVQPHESLKVMLGVAIFVGGIGTMSFIRRRSGLLAGVFAGILFLFSPYILVTAPYLVTDLGMLWAVSLFPVVLWALDRALVHGRGRDLAILGLTSAALWLADSALSPILFVLVGGWMVWVWLIEFSRSFWRVPLAGLLIGMGLAAFYFIPARAEWDEVIWTSHSAYPSAVDTTTLLGPFPSLDRSAFNPQPTLHLGTALWLFAFFGMAVLGWELIQRLQNRSKPSSEEKSTLIVEPGLLPVSPLVFIYFAGLTVALLVVLTQGKQTLPPIEGFDRLKLIDLLGVMVFCCAILGSQMIVFIERYLQHFYRRIAGLLIVGGVLMLASVNLLYTPEFLSVRTPVTVGQYIDVELRGHTLSTLREGLLLPVTVSEMPSPSAELLNSYALEQIDKIEKRGLPANVRVSIRRHTATTDDFVIETPTEQDLTILTFNFPGWEAQQDNQALEVQTSVENGLIRLPLRSGRNDILLQFRDTSIRSLSWVLSGSSFLVLAVAAMWMERRQEKVTVPFLNPMTYRLIRERQVLVMLLVALMGAVVALARLTPEGVSIASPSSTIPPTATTLRRIVDGGIGFLGYDLSVNTANAGEEVVLTTFWRANRPNLPDYQIRILLLENDSDTIVYQHLYRHISDWPSNRWRQQGYIMASYLLALPDDLPSGTYTVALEVSNCEQVSLTPCEDALPRQIFDQRPLGSRIVLSQTLKVE